MEVKPYPETIEASALPDMSQAYCANSWYEAPPTAVPASIGTGPREAVGRAADSICIMIYRVFSGRIAP
jgi:hypothetical protein